jgi:hypothetical protein
LICNGLCGITAFLTLILKFFVLSVQKQITGGLKNSSQIPIKKKKRKEKTQTSLYLMSKALFISFKMFIDLGI